jgi:hypothetical protein
VMPSWWVVIGGGWHRWCSELQARHHRMSDAGPPFSR